MKSQRLSHVDSSQSLQSRPYTTESEKRGPLGQTKWMKKLEQNMIKCEIIDIQNLIDINNETINQVSKQMTETSKLRKECQEHIYLLKNQTEKEIRQQNEQRISELTRQREQKQKDTKKLKEKIFQYKNEYMQLNHKILNLEFEFIKIQETNNQKEKEIKKIILTFEKFTKTEAIKKLQQTLKRYNNKLQFQVRQLQRLTEELNKIQAQDFIRNLFNLDLNIQQTIPYIKTLIDIIQKNFELLTANMMANEYQQIYANLRVKHEQSLKIGVVLQQKLGKKNLLKWKQGNSIYAHQFQS